MFKEIFLQKKPVFLRLFVILAIAFVPLFQPSVSQAVSAPKMPELSADQAKMAALLAAYYRKAGWSEDVVAGIVSNLFYECSLNPAKVNINGASGLAQWLGIRRRNFIQQYGVPPHQTSWQTQAGFIQRSLTQKDSPYKFVGNELRSAKTSEEASFYFARDYEVPGRNRKEASAVARNRARTAQAWKNFLKRFEKHAK